MTEDIKKQIEQEAVKHQEWLFDGVWEDPTLAESKLQCIEDFKKGGNFGAELVLSAWQYATRWRKVIDELPEVREGETYQILVKNTSGIIEVFYISTKAGVDYLKYAYTHWQPINP